MSNTALYPVGTLAKLFNITERRVQQLASQGIIPKAERGQYPLLGAIRGYVLFLQQRAEHETPSHLENAALQRMRLRLMTAQADRIEHDNQVLQGQWVEVHVVKQALEEVGAVFTSCVDALPGRLAFALTGIEDPAVMKAKLFEACRTLRNTTGEKLHALGERMQSREGAGPANSSALTEDTGSVGG